MSRNGRFPYSGVLSPSSRGTSHEDEAYTVPSHRDEALRTADLVGLSRDSGHTSVRSLAKYAKVSAEALARHQAERDPARRR